MSIFMHFIFASLATTFFSVFWHIPKKALIPAGINGGIGWTLYKILMGITSNEIISNFLPAILVSLISEFLARKLKQPAILFVIPGIVPLVPGLGMYNTMLNLVQRRFDLAISTGASVLFVGGSISLGVLIVTSLSKTINIYNLKRRKKYKNSN